MTRPPCRVDRRGELAARPPRSGFSLAELLMATAIAMVVMGAVASLFGVFGRTVSQSQALVDLGARMRSSAWQLRQDLAGTTVDLVPWTRPESNTGYFELLEGPQRDATLALVGGTTASTTIEGDTDDILLFTTRAVAGPFTGRFGGGTIESDCAEVAWFCRPAGSQPVAGTTLYNLHRRQLLVANYVGQAPFFDLSGGTAATVPVTSLVSGSSTPLYDLSLRLEGTGAVPNTLADVTKRENRCFLRSGTGSLRSGTGAVFPLITDTTSRMFADATFDGTERIWEDVLLTNVIAFDVRVFDPAPAMRNLTTTTGTITTTIGRVNAGDAGYTFGTGVVNPRGAYVDLGWGGGSPTAIASGTAWPPANQTAFQSAGMRVRNATTNNTLPVATYDTWSLHYEFNGIDDDGDGVVDEGTNGIDDNANGIADDPAEYETSPPYPVPLRGIEVRIRCFDPSSREVRQITIQHSFVKK